jgi:hypothetical protein
MATRKNSKKIVAVNNANLDIDNNTDPTTTDTSSLAVADAIAVNSEAIVASTVMPGTLPSGVVSFLAFDSATGSVFVREDKETRGFAAAVLADTPLGRKCVRFSSDWKASIRYANAINNGKGTPGCSAAICVAVSTDTKPHRESIAAGAEQYQGRNRKAQWYVAMSQSLAPVAE